MCLIQHSIFQNFHIPTPWHHRSCKVVYWTFILSPLLYCWRHGSGQISLSKSKGEAKQGPLSANPSLCRVLDPWPSATTNCSKWGSQKGFGDSVGVDVPRIVKLEGAAQQIAFDIPPSARQLLSWGKKPVCWCRNDPLGHSQGIQGHSPWILENWP